VGDSTSQISDRLHLLCLTQLLFQLGPLRDVFYINLKTKPALLVTRLPGAHPNPQRLAIPALPGRVGLGSSNQAALLHKALAVAGLGIEVTRDINRQQFLL